MKRILFVLSFLLTCMVSWADILGPFPVSETTAGDYPGLSRVVMSGTSDRRVVLQSVEHPEEVYVLHQIYIADSENNEVPSVYFITPGEYKVIMICGGTSFSYPNGIASENDVVSLGGGFICIF